MKKFLTIIIATFVVLLWGAWFFAPWWMHRININWNLSEVGPWGDSFGVINALFSGLAFVAVVRTLMLQSEELSRQQREIERQQRRLDASDRDAQIDQFERTFFQLLGLFREARDEVVVKGSGGNFHRGREGFEQAHRDLVKCLRGAFIYNPADEELAEVISSAYKDNVHTQAEQTLGPYYRLLYTLLRRISEQKMLSATEKAKYGNLIRSQLSSAEVICIVANGLTKDANNFKDYLEEFRIPRYLPAGTYRDWIGKVYKPESLEARD
ncbi:putative phage abortive infection protein [Agrobacterium tumefaciens]|uniref:putative phage abortive infection protein n=1 Tax=Agrobacterium tumefaciens TaxID=358 RepID=UPI0021D34746|nr:putative phage abortive infection protein [Agrobacterium tumefaciens]UXS09198.1 hypothetical protein FY155_06080 [Agrobacterium tumefaciens]UXS16557.1 hypothetical protein FY154_06075 [Agrobacterium tumefaciens]